MFHVCLRQYFQGGWFIRGITGLDESEWVGRRPELLTLDYNFGGTSRSGIDVPRIVGSENRLSCMIYDAAWLRSLVSTECQVACTLASGRNQTVEDISVSNRGRIGWCIGAFRCFVVFDSCQG